MQENFIIPMICIKPPLVGYFERNSIFNFGKMVLGYVKTVWIHQRCPSLFKAIIADWEISPMRPTTTAGAGETKSGIYTRQWL